MTMALKVLFCLPSISRAGGGVSESARLQALALASGGDVAVSVLTFEDEHFERDLPTWLAVPVRAFKVFGPRSFSFSPAFLIALLRERPDIVHVHGVWQFHCLAVYLWSLISGGRYIVTPHGMLEKWIRARSRGLKWLVSILYQNRFLHRAAALQVLTEREVADVSEFVVRQPVAIIPNYVAAFVHDDRRPGWWREEYEPKDIYLFLGRIHEKKGCLELCRAWNELCEKDTDFRARSVLVFCGWNDGLGGFENAVSALYDRFANAIFAGPQYGVEKQRSLSRASFFVLPSKSEGLPMSILEAWSAQVPVLMTDECNLPLGFERQAAISTGTDRESIVGSLKQASSLSQDARDVLSRNGLLLLEESYSQVGVGDALVRLYRDAGKYP